MIKLLKQVNLEGYTLIVPSVAVGNVAQLAMDLLIYNINMTKIGQIFSPNFIPFVGPDPYDVNSPNICTTMDLYIQQEKHIIALQIRSPPLNKLTGFFEELRDFITEQKITKVVILTSKWQFVRHNRQLRSAASTRYVASPSIEAEYSKQFEELKWCKLEENTNPPNKESNHLEISGGGFAPSLFEYLNKRKVACAILLKFCSEGNNSPDAKELACYLNEWISLIPKDKEGNINWKEPPSWLHMFGYEAPNEIY